MKFNWRLQARKIRPTFPGALIRQQESELMKKERTNLPLSSIKANAGQLSWLPKNPRQWTQTDIDRTRDSILEDPDFLEDRPLLVVPDDKGGWIVFAGNLRREGARAAKLKEVPCIVYYPETDSDHATIKRRAIKDNGSFGSWDYDALANEWDDLDLDDWGVPVWDTQPTSQDLNEIDQTDEIERKRREFEERMKAGEISEEDEEYQAFLEKFQLKKTTDDCYTPPIVYETVAKWVAEHYGLNQADFVRPFYPGGDYQNEKYGPNAIVVDNPPFSILADILNYYREHRIKFFLFAPSLTLFSSSSAAATALPLAVGITYENGASVNTSFLTNLEDHSIRLRSEPSLFRAIKEANDQNLRLIKKELPKYSYDHHIITSSFVGALSRLGIEFSVPVAESESISQLDAQKASGKAIYGKGYIVSDRVYAEREKAERWELSPREIQIVERLNKTSYAKD